MAPGTGARVHCPFQSGYLPISVPAEEPESSATTAAATNQFRKGMMGLNALICRLMRSPHGCSADAKPKLAMLILQAFFVHANRWAARTYGRASKIRSRNAELSLQQRQGADAIWD